MTLLELPLVYNNWKALLELGRGGQGIVYLAYDMSSPGLELLKRLVEAPAHIEVPGNFDNRMIDKLILMQAPNMVRYGALKIIRNDDKARDEENAAARTLEEVEAYKTNRHPNLVKILDDDPVKQYFVLEYHSGGPLSKQAERFKSRPRYALKQFRRLVDGVSRLHEKYVHRDIKPENIFIAHDGRLVLGDMGLVHRPIPDQERLTNTFSNVGTRAWMPPWAMNVRQDKVTASFDVYGLGKILWFLVTGQQAFAVAYEKGSISSFVQNPRHAQIIENIISQCVVSEEKNCLPNAAELLKLIDNSLLEMRLPGSASLRDLEISLHSFRRRGGACVLSVDMPETVGRPIENRTINWTISHPSVAGVLFGRSDEQSERVAWGRVMRRAELHQPLSLDLCTLSPKSHDNYVQLHLSSPIPLMECRYLHMFAKLDGEVPFSIQVTVKQRNITYFVGLSTKSRSNTDKLRWLRFDEQVLENEYQVFVVDIHEAFSKTWADQKVEGNLASLLALQIHGAFSLTSLRLI